MYNLACAPIEDSDQPAHPMMSVLMVDKDQMFLHVENYNSDETVQMCRLI